ncbi:MAG: NUDIX domain-containing protein [Planctomycetota bacterium]|jgi:8-oxo-dGTP pyrophosphatase MutT (NUDIX family)
MYVPKACGFVLVREGAADWEYLLLTNRRRGEPGLPKGHVDPGETELETALRETAEETGLEDLDVDPYFRKTLRYAAERKGRVWDKTVVYFLARWTTGEVRLSPEHTAYAWVPLSEILEALAFENLRAAVRSAALFLKDGALFRIEAATEAEAYAHLCSLPETTDALLAHLKGGARLARRFARALADAGVRIDVEAAAAGTLLHDVGRALGRHDDHQLAGLEHLRTTPLAAYAFACISHFTKGATHDELTAAGLTEELVGAFHRRIDCRHLTWEERCAALADACMKGPDPVPPAVRFADLRRRYDATPVIDLQERRTAAIHEEMAAALGGDPLAVVDLAD